MIVVGLALVCILSLFTKRFTISLFSGIWIVALLFVGNEQFEALNFISVQAIVVMLISTFIGFFLSKYKFVIDHSFAVYDNLYETGSDKTVIKEKILRCLLVVCLLIFGIYFLITIRNAGSFNLAIIRSLNASNSDTSAFKGNFDTLLYYVIAQPIFTVTAIAVVYTFFTRQRLKRSTMIVFFVDFLVYLFTNGGRVFVICVGCFALAGVFRTLMIRGKERLNLKFVMLIVIALITVLTLMTNSRTGNGITFIRQVREYIGCSIVQMDQEILNISSHRNGSINFGYFTYGGFLYYPIKIINMILGINIQAPSEYFNYLQTFRTINFAGRNVYYNALVPNAFYYYFDSGMLGVCVFSLIAGYIQGKYETWIKKVFSFKNFAFYAISVYSLLFSPMGSQAWKIFIPLSIVWCIIINRFIGDNHG